MPCFITITIVTKHCAFVSNKRYLTDEYNVVKWSLLTLVNDGLLEKVVERAQEYLKRVIVSEKQQIIISFV